jgi:hypothetical protein
MKDDFESYLPKIERVKIDCTLENLFDSMWLFNNTPWLNHHGKIALYKMDNTSTVYCYHQKDKMIHEINFDEVEISAIHTFGGNQYHYRFMFNGEEISAWDFDHKRLMSTTLEGIKKQIEKYLDGLIKQKKLEGEELVNTYNSVLLPKIKIKFC